MRNVEVLRDGKLVADYNFRGPVYVDGPVTVTRYGGGLWVIESNMRFPVNDFTVDRQPFVDSATLVLAAWNLTGIGAAQLGAGRFIAQEYTVRSNGLVRPDQIVRAQLVGRAVRGGERGNYYGTARISFMGAGCKILTEIDVQKFTKPRLKAWVC